MSGSRTSGPPEGDGPEKSYHHDGDNLPTHGHHDDETLREDVVRLYWRANLKLLGGLLVIWFVVSFLFGIILVDVLNQFHLGGYPLGFWFAQQGSIYSFLVLIFVYSKQMNKLDRKYDVHEDDE